MNAEQQALAHRISKGDQTALLSIDTELRKYAAKICFELGIASEHTGDIYQNSIMALVQSIRKEGFVLTSKLGTFFYSICRMQAIKYKYRDLRLARAEDWALAALPSSHSGITLDDNSVLRETNIVNRVQHLIKRLSPACRELLLMYYADELSMEEIAARLEYSGPDVAKTKKYKCLACLKRMVKENDRKLLLEE